MFMASCYWPPVPIDTPLSTPWSDNITTFGDALLSRIPDLPTNMIPSAIPIIDRCWCDFSGGLFEPFNTTRWEANSVDRLARELELRLVDHYKRVESGEEELEIASGVGNAPTLRRSGARNEASMSTSRRLSSILEGVWPFSRAPPPTSPTPPPLVNNGSAGAAAPSPEQQREQRSQSPISPRNLFPGLQKEYDLRPYGFDMVVNLGWSR